MKKFILLIATACLPIAASYGVLECRQCKEAHKKDGTKSPFLCHRVETMQNHLLLKHGTYLCCDCRKCFKTFGDYRTHISGIHEKTTCSYCIWRTFKTTKDYELHKDSQHFAYVYQCGNCFGRFPTIERCVIHMITQHKRYMCRYCLGKASGDKDKNSEKVCRTARGFTEENKYWTHVVGKHGKYICLQCNMRAFNTEDDYNKHLKDDHKEGKKEKIETLCGLCKHTNTFRYKAEQKLHELQHAFLLFFLKKTICGYECCVPFQKALSGKTPKRSSKEEKNPETEAVRAFAMHVSKDHKRCLFCENPVAKESAGILEGNLANLTYKQIRYDARMFIQLDANTFSKGEIPVIPCDMCESALQPNRKSRLFFASIKEFPFGKGLSIRDYPFHHLAYDEQKAEKNVLLSVIKEVPANEEESLLNPKKNEKDDVILGEEDEAEDAENDEEEEDRKEDEKEDKKEEEKVTEPKTEK